jgi:phospholipase/carboxylesterase
MTRRQFISISSALTGSAVLGQACTTSTEPIGAQDGRLMARPGAPVESAASGVEALGLDPSRDGILRVPANAKAPLPLLVMLHGASSRAARFLPRFEAEADAAGIALLVPDARSSTWDAIRGRFGPDVAFLDRALARAFSRVAVDPLRIAIGGFSDGATYAITLGLINGDLFRRIVAFSPGFFVEGTPSGKPGCFISHGVSDEILPIDRCSRRIVSVLRKRGYDIEFREFAGGHEMPTAILNDGFAWAKR